MFGFFGRLSAVLAISSCLVLPPPIAHAANPSAQPSASPVKAKELTVSREGDLGLACGALSQEAALMRDIVSVTQGLQERAENRSRGVEAAGAVGSLLIGSVTGGLGLAAAGYFAKSAMDDNYDSAESVQDLAAQRRSFMMGIYNAKGCYGPIEHVMHIPEAQAQDIANIEPAAGEPASGNLDVDESPEGYNQ